MAFAAMEKRSRVGLFCAKSYSRLGHGYGISEQVRRVLWKNAALAGLCALLFLTPSPMQALSEGELHFTVRGKTYTTQNAIAALQAKGDKTRIMIAVKDVEQRFMLTLTVDVARGDEQKTLRVSTEDTPLGFTLRTPQGALAVIPSVQLAKPTNDTYSVQFTKETNEWEDDPADQESPTKRRNRKRRKVRTEYQRVKPTWHTMTSEQRRQTGEGVIANHAFDDTYFTVTLIPVIEAGKVISYEGVFSGTARFSQSISGAQVVPVNHGAFKVRVQYAP